MGLSIQHLLLTLAIVILIFGTKRLKTLGSDVGDAIKGFRKAVKEGEEDSSSSIAADADFDDVKGFVQQQERV